MKLKIKEGGVKHFHYGNSPESKRKEIADRFGKPFTPDDHVLTCKDGKSINIQIGKKYKCTAFDGQRVEVVDIEDMFDDGSAMLDVAHRNNRYTVSSTQIYESKLHEQDVEIEVKHEGILEVPEGKNVDDLPLSHFEKLAKKKGLGKITKALNNLQVWNKNDDPKLSKWAGDMIDKLNKKLKKDESINEDYIDGEYYDEHTLSKHFYDNMTDYGREQLFKTYNPKKFDSWLNRMLKLGYTKIDIMSFLFCVDEKSINNIKLWMGLDESIKEYYIGSEYGEYFDEHSLRQRYNTMMMSGQLDDIINLYHDLGGDFDEFAIEATERGFSKIDIFTVGLCVEDIPVKEIEKRLRMLHLMDESVGRNMKEDLDSDCYELTNSLKKLGYSCGEPFDVFGKKMCSCTKFYDRGNGEYGDGIEVSIDPCDGTVELRDYYLDDDLEECDENITRMCPVRKVLTADDVLKIDRWVKKNMYFRSDREW